MSKLRDSTKAKDDEITRNLVGLARTRPDIFGEAWQPLCSPPSIPLCNLDGLPLFREASSPFLCAPWVPVPASYHELSPPLILQAPLRRRSPRW